MDNTYYLNTVFKTNSNVFSAIFFLSIFQPNIALADDKYFSCTSGDVLNADCWVSGATPAPTDNSYIGNVSTQTANLSSGSFENYIEYLGYSGGIGNFTQIGGTHTNISLRLGFDGIGNYNLVDGNLTSTYEYIYAGTFTQTGGTHSAPVVFSMGGNSGDQAIYNLSTGSLDAPYSTIGGSGGTGTFNQTGGTYTATSLKIGSGQSYVTGIQSKGYYNLSAGILASSTETIGNDSGSGYFTQTGGTNTTSLLMMGGAGSTSIYNLNDGTLNVGDIEKISVSGQSTLNINGGEINWSGNSIEVSNLNIGSSSSSRNSLTLENGKSINAYNIAVHNRSTFNFNGGTLAVNNFTGDLVNNGGTLTPDSTSPFSTIGTTNVNGDYTQNSFSTYSVEIENLLSFDKLNVTGIATLAGELDVTLANNAIFQDGDSFDILFAESIVGEFDLLSLAILDEGLAWDFSFIADAIGTTDIARLSVISTVPVPAAVWLFGSGLIGLVGFARRKKS